MEGSLQFEYYYGAEGEQFRFFRIPKALFEEDYFRTISCESKLLYSLMLDRMSLSQRSGWINSENRAYIIFTVDKVMESIGCSKDKARKLIGELYGIGLIEKRRKGLGKPDLIYVKNFVKLIGNNSQKGNQTYSSENLSEAEKADFKRAEIPYSRGSENSLQESGKSATNDTDIIDTDYVDDESILSLSIIGGGKNIPGHGNDSGNDETAPRKAEEGRSGGIDVMDSIERAIAGKGVKETFSTIKRESDRGPILPGFGKGIGQVDDRAAAAADERKMLTGVSLQHMGNHGFDYMKPMDAGKNDNIGRNVSCIAVANGAETRYGRSDEAGLAGRHGPKKEHDANSAGNNYAEALDLMLRVRENIGYDAYMNSDGPGDKDMFDGIYRTICDIVTGRTDSYTIGGVEYPSGIVKKRFLKLNREHVIYVIMQISESRMRIRNIKKYLVTSLFNAPTTMDAYFTQRVNYDLHEGSSMKARPGEQWMGKYVG